MPELKAVIAFAVITLGLGWGLLSSVSAARPRSPLMGGLEVAGVGLAAFSFLGVVFSLLHIPLHWTAYLGVASAGFAVAIVQRRAGKTRAHGEWDREQTWCAWLLLALLAIFFAIYWMGATSYPYLEDDDPWLHAQGALYVAREHTYRVDPALRPLGEFAFYLEPYPPTFDVLMGVLRQLDDSVYITLKLFNVILVTLALGFHFLFATAFLQSPRKGLFAALVLAALPSFMSHFIWSQSLALCIFPVALYSAMRALDDRTWVVPAVVSIASLMVTQPVVSLMAGVVLMLLVLSVFLRELASPAGATRGFSKTARGLLVGAAGLALSFVYWGAQIAKWGLSGILGLKGDEFTSKWQSDYALRQATLADTIFPSAKDKIDQATGWGPIVTIALILGLLDYALRVLLPPPVEKRAWTDVHLVLWFVPLFYLVFAPSFGLPAWGSSRSWAYLAIPVALLATEGVFGVARMARRRDPRLETVVVLAAAAGVLATSAPAKIQLQTAGWSSGQQWEYEKLDQGFMALALGGFVKMRELLPRNTRVYSFCGSGRSIGFDMDSTPWATDEAFFRRRGGDITLDDALRFLDRNRYSYFTMDVSCTRQWGFNAADGFARAIGKIPRVRPVYAERGFVLAELTTPDPPVEAHEGAGAP